MFYWSQTGSLFEGEETFDVLSSLLFSPDHSVGVQLLLCPHPCPLLPHHPGVPPPSARRGGLHSTCHLFPLLQQRPDAPAEQGQEDSCHQAFGHRPGGLHRLLHALPHPPGVGLLPGQSGRGGAREGARARLSHHCDLEQPEQLPGSRGLLLRDGQLQENVEDEDWERQGGGRGRRANKWGRRGEELSE